MESPVGLVLLLGGARSGKSTLAVQWGKAFDGPVTFLATGEAGDQEMKQRIARHRAERPAAWSTVEEPYELDTALTSTDPSALVIIDCLTLWVANVMGHADDNWVLAAARAVCATADARDAPTVVISNEVGSGIVPVDPFTRRFRDLLGEVNATIARRADHALLLIAGRVLTLDPPPSGTSDLF